MNTINFLEKKKLTYIIIFIFVVFALIHLYKINKQTNEGFDTIEKNSDIKSGIFVDIPLLSQVRFGDIKNGSLNTGLDDYLALKANASDLDSKADVSALNSKADVSDLNDKADKIALNSKANSSVVNSLTDTVTGLTTNVTNLMNNPSLPDYTIMEYAGPTTSIPAGWQLCNGTIIKNTNGDEMTTPRVGGGSDPMLTPNLNMIKIIDNVLRWHSWSYDNLYWMDSSLYSRRAWHSSNLGVGYMRLQLDKLFKIYGIVVGARADSVNQCIKTLEAYVSDVSFSSVNEINFINSPYEIGPNTDTIKTTFCKVSNSSIISTNLEANTTLKKIMFDTPIIGNVLTIKPLTSTVTSIGLRVAVVAGPINNYIVKQPKKI